VGGDPVGFNDPEGRYQQQVPDPTLPIWCPGQDRFVPPQLCGGGSVPPHEQKTAEDYAEWATRHVPRDETSTVLVQSILEKRLRDFESSNCAKVLGSIADAETLRSYAKKIIAYDVRDSRFANLTQNQVFANGRTITLSNSVPFGIDAAFASGPAAFGILAGGNFWSNPRVGDLALHELLHLFRDDGQLFDQFAGQGLTHNEPGTDEITQWLSRDCKPKPPVKR
jgi:hypothetical protein